MRRVSYSDTKCRVLSEAKTMHLIFTMAVSSSAPFWCFYDSSLDPKTQGIFTKYLIINLAK